MPCRMRLLQMRHGHALLRSRRVESPRVEVEPTFDGPAPVTEIADRPLTPRAVLDPFAVYAQGERVLRQELSALDLDHLRGIIRSYALGGGVAAESSSVDIVAEYIVSQVRERALGTQSERVSEAGR